MSTRAHPPDAAPVQALRLPQGELREGADGRLRLHVSRTTGQGRMLRDFVSRAKGLRAELLWLPEGIEEQGEELLLLYPPEPQGTVSVARAIRAWRRNLAIGLPVVFDLAQLLAEMAPRLQASRLHGLISSPTLIRYTPRTQAPWRLMALPAVATTLSDWVQADPLAWVWAPPEALLAGAPGCPSYLVGAAMHQGLAGDPFPDLLGARERIQRLLSGRIGAPSALGEAVAAALPRGLQEEGRSLCRFVLALLDPDPARRPGAAEMSRGLAELRHALSPHRLATHWEMEDARGLALDVLAFRAELAPPAEIPWSTVARLKQATGDLQGAARAAIRSLELGQTDELHRHHRLLMRACQPGAPEREALARALVHLDASSTAPAGDMERLYLAHLEARCLDAPNAALVRLAAPCTGRWADTVRIALMARILSDRDEYAQVSRMCRAARAELLAMPGGGGHAGGYLRAYLALLDGIANFGAVGKFQRMDFVGDAFEALVASLDLARETGANDLAQDSLHWLGWLAHFAERFPSDSFGIVYVGVRAYLRALGLHEQSRSACLQGAPRILWFDEDVLLPSDGTDTAGKADNQ